MTKEKTKYAKENLAPSGARGRDAISTNTVVAIALAILFLFSAFQATQLIALDATVAENNQELGAALGSGTATATQTAQTATQETTQNIPQNLQDVPEMVGGC